MEGAGNRTYDPNGLLNVKLSGCSWSNIRAPIMRKVDIPYFMLNDPEEMEGFFGEAVGSSAGVKELTGIFKRAACVAAQGNMAVESSEVICLCYRIKSDKNIVGDDGNVDRSNRSSISVPNSPLPNNKGIVTSITTTTAANIDTLPLPLPLPHSLLPSDLGHGNEKKKEERDKDYPTEIEGYLDWCERGARSRFNGTISASGRYIYSTTND